MCTHAHTYVYTSVYIWIGMYFIYGFPPQPKRKNMTKFIRCSLLLLLLNEANLLGGTMFAILTGYTTHSYLHIKCLNIVSYICRYSSFSPPHHRCLVRDYYYKKIYMLNIFLYMCVGLVYVYNCEASQRRNRRRRSVLICQPYAHTYLVFRA